MARPGGVLLPPGVGFPPPSLVGLGKKEGGEREEGKGGATPLVVQFGPEGEGHAACPGLLSLSLHYGPIRPIHLPGGSGNLLVLR